MYLKGTANGLTERDAAGRMMRNMPAIVRPQEESRWGVIYLSLTPIQPGQAEFQLSEVEKVFLSISH